MSGRHRYGNRHEPDTREVVLGYIFLILVLAAFALAGTIDWQSEQAYMNSWNEETKLVSDAHEAG